MVSKYVYIRNNEGSFSVGHYDPRGHFHEVRQCDSPTQAQTHVTNLNGGHVLEKVKRALELNETGRNSECSGVLRSILS